MFQIPFSEDYIGRGADDPTRRMDAHPPTEQTPLLSDCKFKECTPRKPTPLPKFQIGIALMAQVCEPITSQSIYPYINQLISELDITGGDERKVGYYAGLIESLFFATEAMTVFQWSRISDHVGRKPILLIGLFGTMVSMLCFGLSRTFWTLVVSRCLTGLLNGNIGVMKSTLGELTDSTNRASGFSLIPIVWGFGGTVGPMLGGSLSRPHERFPKFFGGEFWRQYPYFLPCLAASSLVFLSFILILLFFKETVKHKYDQEGCDHQTDSEEGPVPLRELFVYPVIISISNYVVLAFLDIAVTALLPLFLAMPLEIGGFDLDPPKIGWIIGIYGTWTALFQALYFSRLVNCLGVRKVFILSMSMFLIIFLSLPAINIAALMFGKHSVLVGLLIPLLLVALATMDLGFGAIFMYIMAAAPNKRSLGATNGLSQTTVSIARTVGPALAASMFSYSVERNILNGYAVYLFFSILTVGALYLASLLPVKVWDEIDH